MKVLTFLIGAMLVLGGSVCLSGCTGSGDDDHTIIYDNFPTSDHTPQKSTVKYYSTPIRTDPPTTAPTQYVPAYSGSSNSKSSSVTTYDDAAFFSAIADDNQILSAMDAISYYAQNMDIDGVGSASTILKSRISSKMSQVSGMQVSPKYSQTKSLYLSALSQMSSGADEYIQANRYYQAGDISSATSALNRGNNRFTSAIGTINSVTASMS